MEKTLFIITVAVVTAMNYEELMRPASDKVTEYTVSVEAETVEKAELMAGKIIADDSTKFDKETQYIKIVDAKLASGARPIYKDDNIDYRQLQRALRRYHMWPYATRTVELAIDNCVYKGMTPDAAAKWIYEHPEGIATSPNRDAQGDELTALQMMYAELKRKEGVRFEKMQNPEQKSAPESAEKKEPLYPNAGLERYIQQNPEVTKKLADLSKPEQVVTVGNESAKEENDMDDKKLREWIEECLDCDDKTFEIIYRGVHLKLEVYSYYDERYDGGGNEISVYVKSWRLTNEKEEILGAESYDDGFNDETAEDVLDAFHEAATTEDKNESAKEEENNMENIINETVNAYTEAAEAAATNPVPDFMTAVNNLNEEEEETMEEIGARELMRLDDFAHVLHSSLIENKEPQEKHDYERILYALKDNGFHVAMTDVDTSIKGDHIALLYEDDIAPMVTFDIANLPAIKFGRELYKFLALNVKTEESKKVQQTLIAMFSGKQKTTAQPKAETVENKTAQSAPKKEEKAMTKNEWEDLANLENTCSAKEKHADNIVAEFSMRQNGVETPASVSLSVWGKKAEDPAYIFKGGIFDKGKYVGYWKWDIREKGGFKCPCFVTTNNVFYSYHEDKDGNPTSNTSRMLLAIAEALGKTRGIKSGATYKQKRLGGNTGVMDCTAPAEYDGAPTRVENIRPIRSAAGQAEQELPVTPEKESPLPTQSDFWGEAI